MNKISRRQFFAHGGAAISLGALIAACGNTEGPTEAGRLGNGDEGEALPPVVVDDTVLARTTQSLHLSAARAQQAVLDSGECSAAVAAALPAVIALHQQQAAAFAEHTGGSPFDCSNPFFDERYVDPSIEKFNNEDSSNKQADADKLAIAFEEWTARSQQDLTARVGTELRATMISNGVENARNSALLSLAAGEPPISPTLMGDDAVDTDDAGYPIYYALPARFGLVSPVPVVVGDLDEDGLRYSINLQTPADNSFVTSDVACSA